VSEELPTVDLREYVEKVRNTFQVEPYASIDYQTIERLPTEMERREATLSYFIPDIFEIGKYDRRMDIIDGCIYCLETLEESKYAILVRNLWARRAGIDVRVIFNPADIEEDSYGYTFYHPLLAVVSDPTRPKVWVDVLINLVQYLQCFRGRRRKLTLDDYSLIYFSMYHSTPKRLSKKLYKFLQILEGKIHESPLRDGIDIKYLMETANLGPKRLLTEFREAGVRFVSVFERASFDLENFIFQCPFPHHVRVFSPKWRQGQSFLTGGQDIIQEINTNIPYGFNWSRLYQKFPPETRCFRVTHLPLPQEAHSFLNFLDPTAGRWQWNHPWDRVMEEWSAFIRTEDRAEAPVQVNYGVIEPTLDLMKVCAMLEEDGNLRNAAIERSTRVPQKKVIELRVLLDTKALAWRALMANVPELMDTTVLTVDGREIWKYHLLVMLGKICPLPYINLLQNMNTKEYLLQGTYWHIPEAAVPFCQTFIKVFHGHFHYTLHKRLIRGRPRIPWYEGIFDPACGWVWDPEDYIVQRM
jgi:hypothetical protein